MNENKKIDNETLTSKIPTKKVDLSESQMNELLLELERTQEVVKNNLDLDRNDDILENIVESFKPNFYDGVLNVKFNPSVVEVKNFNVFSHLSKMTVNPIKNVDFLIRRGEFVGLVGESGVGKSLFAKSLLNISTNTVLSADKADLDGVDLIKLKDFTQVRGRKAYYIPSSSKDAFDKNKKIKKHFMELIKKYRSELTREEVEKYIYSLLEEFAVRDITLVLKQYPDELSEEIKQRLLLALSIVSRPNVIIADSITENINVTTHIKMLDLLHKINKKYGIAILLVTNNILHLLKFAHYIYVMYAGKIIERGSWEDIFMNPLHPYTWFLIGSPKLISDKLESLSIEGYPPSLFDLPTGDAFAQRNPYALEIDFVKEPPLIELSNTHCVATWLLHPGAPKFELPEIVAYRVEKFKHWKETAKANDELQDETQEYIKEFIDYSETSDINGGENV